MRINTKAEGMFVRARTNLLPADLSIKAYALLACL